MLRHKVTKSQFEMMSFIRREVNRAYKHNKFPGYVTHEFLDTVELPRQSKPSDLDDDQMWLIMSLALAAGARGGL